MLNAVIGGRFMEQEQPRRSGLTRSLLLGVSLGSIAVVQVGCATPQAQNEARTAGTEEQLCERALASADRSDVEELLRAYPNGRCVPATLSALPPETLAQISPSVAARLSPATLAQVAPEARIHLPKRQGSGGPTGNLGGTSS